MSVHLEDAAALSPKADPLLRQLVELLMSSLIDHGLHHGFVRNAQLLRQDWHEGIRPPVSAGDDLAPAHPSLPSRFLLPNRQPVIRSCGDRVCPLVDREARAAPASLA